MLLLLVVLLRLLHRSLLRCGELGVVGRLVLELQLLLRLCCLHLQLRSPLLLLLLLRHEGLQSVRNRTIVNARVHALQLAFEQLQTTTQDEILLLHVRFEQILPQLTSRNIDKGDET